MKIIRCIALPLWIAALFVSTASVRSQAQDKPIAEVTGSYQFNHLTLSEGGASSSLNVWRGWDGSINVPILRWFGVVGDVGRVWESESATFSALGTSISASATTSLLTYGGGPQLTYRSRRVQPFARFILGDAHSSAFVSANSTLGSVSGSASVDSFFLAPGGGADLRIAHNVWLRGGADYFRTSKYGATVNGVRVFGGITFTFGPVGASHDAVETSPSPGHPQPASQRASSVSVRIDRLGVLVAPGISSGAEIIEIGANGAAAQARMHAGDVINRVDDKLVKNPADLATEISSRRSGSRIRLGYSIRGQWQTETDIILP
jgi:hypothetical protein